MVKSVRFAVAIELATRECKHSIDDLGPSFRMLSEGSETTVTKNMSSFKFDVLLLATDYIDLIRRRCLEIPSLH